MYLYIYICLLRILVYVFFDSHFPPAKAVVEGRLWSWSSWVWILAPSLDFGPVI